MKRAEKFLVRKSAHFNVVTFVLGQEDESERERRGKTWQTACRRVYAKAPKRKGSERGPIC